MKRLIVLVAALLLVGLMVTADAPYTGGMGGTISGKVEYRAKADMGDETFANDSVVELKIDGMVDDNNSVYIEFEEGASTLAGAGLADINAFDRAHFTSGLGAALGLPVGLEVRVGFDEFKGTDGIKVTAGENEDIFGTGFTTWGYRVEAMVHEMATIRASFGGDWDIEEMLVGVYGTAMDMVTYELFYVVGTDVVEAGDGNLEVGAEYNGEVSGFPLGVAVLLDYELAAEVYKIGAGVDTTVAEMLRVGLGWEGMKDATAGELQVDLTVTPPIDLEVEVNLFLGFALDDVYGAETFDSAEFSVKLSAGADWYVGYLYSNVGGAIAKEKVELDPDGLEEGAIFLRAVMEF